MKAIVKKEAKAGLWMEELPCPACGEDDLLIKIKKTSICGTDVHLYKWDEWAAKTLPVPSIIGHEFVGHVVEMGKNVRGFSVGDRVSGEGHITCGNCISCRSGERVLCPHTRGVGVNRDGCFAEYLVIPASNAFTVPESISDEIACIFDPLGNAVHTAFSTELAAKDVLITGAGPIGLMSLAIAKKAGARNVVITDLHPYRLELAKKFAPTRIVDISKEDPKKVMKELGMEEGFGVCLEMSGSAAAFEALPDLLMPGGKIMLLGILPEHAKINWHDVIFKMLQIKGIYGREIFRTWYQMAHLLESGLDVAPVITHRFQAHEFQKGFDVMLSGNSGKVILDWS